MCDCIYNILYKIQVFWHRFYKKIILSSSCIAFILFACIYCYSNYSYFNHKRYASIIEVPIEAFDKNGMLIDKKWKGFLRNKKPIGVIFFADHLKNKNIAKNIIREVKQAVGDDNLFLSSDIEGGRVNRIGWVDSPSAEEISEKYLSLKKEYSKRIARKFVERQYKKIFQEMKDVGLNMTFAPNLDLNKYGELDKNSVEYSYYKKTLEYIKLARKDEKKISEFEKQKFKKSWLFYAYLDEIGEKSLDVFTKNRRRNKDKEVIKKLRNEWKNMDQSLKNDLIKHFTPLVKYVNYVSVIGDRSYGKDPKLVAELAKIFVDTANKFDIHCVLKHALGHGRASGDSHINTQYVDATTEELLDDLYPYKQLINSVKFVMLAHVVFSAIDDQNTAINSQKVLDFFKENIGNALFITDDISMKGNKEDKKKNPCDIWLVSNKTIDEIGKITAQNKIDIDICKKWFE